MTCSSGDTLICVACICLTWKGLVGLGVPLVFTVIYSKRVLRDASTADWLLLLALSFLTWGTKTVSAQGVSHAPWYLYYAILVAILAFVSDRASNLPSVPQIGAMCFLSLVVADFASVVQNRPEGMYGAPGGRGLLDGLIVKPVSAMCMVAAAYWAKARMPIARGDQRGQRYDAESRAFLLNVSPRYVRALRLNPSLGNAEPVTIRAAEESNERQGV